jgi:hypothetical protein
MLETVMRIHPSPARWPGLIWLVLAAGLVTGCQTPAGKPSRPRYQHDPMARALAQGLDTNRVVHISCRQKCNPVWWFGNEDDPVPPPGYRPDDPRRERRWYYRNPLHNFTFYLVGIADKPFERVGRAPDKAFHPDGGWNWAVCRYKCLRLPFVSYQGGHCRFYVGWRNRGNFGCKLNFGRAKAAEPNPPVDAPR